MVGPLGAATIKRADQWLFVVDGRATTFRSCSVDACRQALDEPRKRILSA
jgi:hypothetical protein